jgi:hypothetical protein
MTDCRMRPTRLRDRVAPWARRAGLAAAVSLAAAGGVHAQEPVKALPGASGEPGAPAGCPAPVTMTPHSPAPLTLRFVGDMVPGNAHAMAQVPREWDALYFAQVGDYLRSADAAIGNLEGALTVHPTTRKVTGTGRSFAFRFPLHYGRLFRESGFRVLNVANNHSHDFGDVGFAETLRVLGEADVAVAGVKGSFASVELKGLRVAVIGFGFHPRHDTIQDLAGARRLVARAREQNQVVVVTFHGGAEGGDAVWHADEVETFLGENRGNSVAFSRAVIDAGADVVVGHGPHVLRSIECYRGRPIFYSLGNFISVGGLSVRGMAAVSAIAGVQLGSAGELLAIEFLPVVFTERKVPRPDERGFGAHLVNQLARGARFPGQFLQVPADPATQAEFETWALAAARAARPAPAAAAAPRR